MVSLSIINGQLNLSMNLSKRSIEVLKKNTLVRMQFALAIGITESSLLKAIKRNSKSLTNYAGVQVLKKVGLDESEIIEEEYER